jgi:hypothetical protein
VTTRANYDVGVAGTVCVRVVTSGQEHEALLARHCELMHSSPPEQVQWYHQYVVLVQSAPGLDGNSQVSLSTIATRVLVVTVLCLSAACSGSEGQPAQSATTHQPLAPSSVYPTAPKGVVGQPLGAKWTWDSSFTAMQPYLQLLSGGSTWYEVVLCNVEPKSGQFDWDAVDSVVDRARQLGISTMLKIRVGRCWATGGTAKYRRGVADITESAMPLDIGTYTDFVQQVVRRYSPLGVDEFAVENEINSASFWDGTPSQYATLATAAAGAIHAADPKAYVVDAGISSVASGYSVVDALLESGRTDEALQAYDLYYARRFGTRTDNPIEPVNDVSGLQAAMETDYAKSNLAFMATINQLTSDHVFQVRQVHFYEQSSALPYLMSYLAANTPTTVPLQVWELGTYLDNPTMTDAQLTDEVVKSTMTALAEGATKVVWLPLADNPSGRVGESLDGIVSSAGQPQASGDAYAAVAAAAEGGAVVPLSCDGLVGAAFHGSPDTAFVWATGAEVDVVAPYRLDSRSLSTSSSATESTAKADTLHIGSEPLQVTLSGSIRQFEEAATCQS